MKTGKVARILKDKNFGFITDGKRDYFFHRSCCDDSTDFESLERGDEVVFDEEQSPKGPRAVDVTKVDRV